MNTLIFDNYDSFTYNLVQLVQKISGQRPAVHRNNEITWEDVEGYDRILISPGPGLPEDAGILIPMIHRFAGKKPILGVCLGHQAIAVAFGGRLQNLKQVYHGVATPVNILTKNVESEYGLFQGMPATIQAGRYHSWVVERESLPDCLEITAVDDEDQIMALRHRELDIQSVQFHPESILTPLGETIIHNWIIQSSN